MFFIRKQKSILKIIFTEEICKKKLQKVIFLQCMCYVA